MDSFPTALVYTVAVDAPGASGYRTMAKMLASSLLRTQFSGDIVVFHNGDSPLFQIERAGLQDVQIDLPSTSDDAALTELGWALKYRVRELVDSIAKARGHEYILFLDCDCLALRNVDTLFADATWDIKYYAEPGRVIADRVFNCFLSNSECPSDSHALAPASSYPATGWQPHPLQLDGINSGTWAVRASHYRDVMSTWEQIDIGPHTRTRQFSEQAAWNRLILNCGRSVVPCGPTGSVTALPWRVRRFERDTIQRPLHGDYRWQDYTEATVVHCFGVPHADKIKFLFGLYASTFYWEPTSAMLQILEH